MTVKEYNKIFYPAYNKARSFLDGLDHALSKCDDNTRMQLECIGWDENTKEFLQSAICRTHKAAQDSYKWDQESWWNSKKEEV